MSSLGVIFAVRSSFSVSQEFLSLLSMSELMARTAKASALRIVHMFEPGLYLLIFQDLSIKSYWNSFGFQTHIMKVNNPNLLTLKFLLKPGCLTVCYFLCKTFFNPKLIFKFPPQLNLLDDMR